MTNNLNKWLIATSTLAILCFTYFGCRKNNDNDDSLLIWLLLNYGTCKCTDYSLDDPLLSDQWHLNNTGQGGGTSGKDINVTPVWNDDCYGRFITIAVVDDGIDVDHEDLVDAIYSNLNYNYLTSNTNLVSGWHGTSVAGVAAARFRNGLGGRGAAPCACLVGYNLLQYSTSANELDAMRRHKDEVHISNNSWGPTDGTGQLIPSDSSWQDGIVEGIETGRDGKGIVYTWAAGNGGKDSAASSIEIDNSNYDGYANFYGVLAIGALTDDGERAYYSEKGANLWVCTYSNGGSSSITTTDNMGTSGYNSGNYTYSFGGTSSAAPLAAGIIALILEANPDLSWRDVRIILADTAVQVDSSDGDWQTNDAGYDINHKYGFGAIDAEAAVNLARTWTNVGSQVTYMSSTSSPNDGIPDNDANGFNPDKEIVISSSSITSIEFVAIEIEIEHPDSGELDIILQSPAGTQSELSEEHQCYSNGKALGTYFTSSAWYTFGSARHLGESADGTWELDVRDRALGNTGTLKSWRLKFYGR